MRNKLTYRMYFLVPYQFGATIHAGIQPLHASWHYLKEHGMTKELKQWAFKDETAVILNGGTTNDKVGTLNAQIKNLKKMGVKYTTFREPDLNNSLTAISFIMDSRVFEREQYPDFAYIEANFSGKPEYKRLLKQAKELEKIGIFEKRNWVFSFKLSK